jgi:hypothetical protein
MAAWSISSCSMGGLSRADIRCGSHFKRREGVRRNACLCVDAAARNRENRLRPPSPLCPVVTRRPQLRMRRLGNGSNSVDLSKRRAGHERSRLAANLQQRADDPSRATAARAFDPVRPARRSSTGWIIRGPGPSRLMMSITVFLLNPTFRPISRQLSPSSADASIHVCGLPAGFRAPAALDLGGPSCADP